MLRYIILLLASYVLAFLPAQAQDLDTNPINGYAPKKTYVVGKINVVGGRYLDTAVIKTIFGILPGQKIQLPQDDKIAKGMKAVWSQGLLEKLDINVSRMYNDTVDLVILMEERPKFSYYIITGTTKTEKAEITEKLNKAFTGTRIVSEAMKAEICERIRIYYLDKGYSKATVTVTEMVDKAKSDNSVALIINVNRGERVRINQINIVGNEAATDIRLKHKMKNTKEKPRLSLYPAYRYSLYGNEPITFRQYLEEQGYLHPSKTLEYLDPYFRYNIFGSSKYDKRKFYEDKLSLISYYNSIGHRDATIVRDTVYANENSNDLNIDIEVSEGKKYYFGDIEWSGNTKYSDSVLNMVLGIKKGDVYNRELLDSKLGAVPSMDGSIDIGSLYLDQGYLFFSAEAQETSIVGDTINFRINITEGAEARIKRVLIKGNNKTYDYVLRRELYTKPGNVFSRADVFRSVRQLLALGYIDPNTINPVPKPNPADNTVDIIYNVDEKPSDQIEAQAGYGGGIGFTGTIGLTLNNFSLRNIFKKSEWQPIPMGDGQSLALRWQSNGLWFNSANIAFTEPWLGGKKPIGLTVGAVYTRFAEGTYTNYTDPRASYIENWGANVVISKRLKWPDNSFVGAFGISYQNYFLKDYSRLSIGEGFTNGTSNNFNFLINIARTTIDNPIYPRSGSDISLNIKFTPPFSYMGSNSDYSGKSVNEKFKWIEYYKFRFNVDWYQQLKGDLVLRIAGKFGYLGYYNKTIGQSPFERFQVGGDGMTNFTFFIGRDVISQRGYGVYNSDASIFNKYTVELRYPFSLNSSSTIFGLAFFEAGNAWNSFAEYNPFRVNRAVGLGLRMRLPMFGLLGFDYGFGFDAYAPGSKFSSAAKFTFMLGREPD